MILIAGVALVVIGPDRFPEFARIVLRTVRDLRGYVEEAKRDISEELRPVQKEIQDLSRYSPEDYVESLADSVMGDEGDSSPESEESEEADAAEDDEAPYAMAEDLGEEYEPWGPVSQGHEGAQDAEAPDGAQHDGAEDADHNAGDSEAHLHETPEPGADAEPAANPEPTTGAD